MTFYHKAEIVQVRLVRLKKQVKRANFPNFGHLFFHVRHTGVDHLSQTCSHMLVCLLIKLKFVNVLFSTFQFWARNWIWISTVTLAVWRLRRKSFITLMTSHIGPRICHSSKFSSTKKSQARQHICSLWLGLLFISNFQSSTMIRWGSE